MAITTKCKDCGGTYQKSEPGEIFYEHICPPEDCSHPRVIPFPAAPAPPRPARWARVRAMLTRILDWIEGKL